MKTKTQIALAWIFILTLFGTMVFTLYADYQREIIQGRLVPVRYPNN